MFVHFILRPETGSSLRIGRSDGLLANHTFRYRTFFIL